jgi:DNA-directed RNA polymerase subunit N (RpoN/RPB10)
MIIPVRCFTCGKVLADKWEEYERRCKEREQEHGKSDKRSSSSAVVVLDAHKGAVLDELGITRICCRRHMLTHIDLIDVI